MTTQRHTRRGIVTGTLVTLAAGLLVLGCPTEQPIPDDPTRAYDRGFNSGFARDDWYWQGYDDGYDTVGAFPIYYRGDTIPYYETPPYDAGYWDGVWYAYNDGYFVNYRYAFIVGFSEGYDAAFWPDYLAFLAGDVHTEYLNGGWADGYNDGFSEGRIFGANDFEQGLAFDWQDALAAYEDGLDLYFAEIDLGSGLYGPVYLYEYGLDPHTLKSADAQRPPAQRDDGRMIRGGALAKADIANREIFRSLDPDRRQQLSIAPQTSSRDQQRPLRLTSTWYQRVAGYLSGAKSAAATERARAVAAEEETAPAPLD